MIREKRSISLFLTQEQQISPTIAPSHSQNFTPPGKAATASGQQRHRLPKPDVSQFHQFDQFDQFPGAKGSTRSG